MLKGLALLVGFSSLLGAAAAGLAAPGDLNTPMPHSHRGPSGTNYFNVSVPEHLLDMLLCRPEATGISLSILAYQELQGRVVYGTNPALLNQEMSIQAFKAGMPVTVVLDSLTPDTRYYYEFHARLAGSTNFLPPVTGNFQTARPAGKPFCFTLTADCHLDEHTSPEVYRQTLSNIRAENPDFHLDLGNLFMTDKHGTRAEAARQYVAQRYYFGQIAGTTPILLALGTHDGESARYDDGSDDCLAAWSQRLRIRYFPNPLPDGFYSGNTQPDPRTGMLQNYFAWTWGDALIVVLDPFRYSSPQRNHDGWGWSLGADQYHWLAGTLAASHAKFKFVFIHNLLSGDQASRGGVEIAGHNEWGGRNEDGTEGFASHRPGWAGPVRDLLVRFKVTAVFKAHDNFYARQQLDGLPYIMVPQPSFAGDDRIRDLQNYGYQQGIFLGNPGHVKVSVAPAGVTVEYVRSVLPEAEFDNHTNGWVADRIMIPSP